MLRRDEHGGLRGRARVRLRARRGSGLREIERREIERREQLGERQLDGLERRDAGDDGLVIGADPQPAAGLQGVRLELPTDRVDQPQVTDAVGRVEVGLVAAISPEVGRREDLADPVGDDVDRSFSGVVEALASPAGLIGTDDVVRGESNVDCRDDIPAARASATALEGATDLKGQPVLDELVVERWARLGDDLTGEQLDAGVLGEGEQVVVNSELGGERHDARLSWRGRGGLDGQGDDPFEMLARHGLVGLAPRLTSQPKAAAVKNMMRL